MNKTLDRIKSRFLSELEAEKDLWRIYRRSTFLDLIVRDFVKFNKTQDPDLLIDIFNYIIKMRMLEKLSNIELNQDLPTLSKAFGNSKEEIINLYNITLRSISPLLVPSSSDKLHSNI